MSCRTSPPRGGRSAVINDFANHQPCKKGAAREAANLPLVGEMSGRTEGAPRSAIKGITVPSY
ncbi:MAG: hypothetical protein E5Y73_17910 [Mesorhizobium sp.]|nr:MAG: hypothetical protein E5Y86_22100 [Mesorhizobium sp.]TIL90914.1 MAG: hypothetical protein E5Y73_17910 [Mesorhizobium sp.]TIM09536.1 MAG: hypothetical protein E5Y67_27535 [Mesorhizobium sp.]